MTDYVIPLMLFVDTLQLPAHVEDTCNSGGAKDESVTGIYSCLGPTKCVDIIHTAQEHTILGIQYLLMNFIILFGIVA